MIAKLLRFILFSALILIIGQFRINQTTVGELFLSQIKRGFELGRDAAERTTMFSSLGKTDWLKKAKSFFSVKPTAVEPPQPKRTELLELDEEPEHFTPSDREAILKVLE